MKNRATKKTPNIELKNALSLSGKLEVLDATIAVLVSERKALSKTFIDSVREYRRSAKFTTYDLARATGLTQGMVAYMEQGKRSVTDASRKIISDWLRNQVSTSRK